MELGLQTFTLHTLLRKPEDFDRRFAELASMGLHNLELAVDYLPLDFSVKSAQMIASTAKKHGLQIRSCQIKYDTSANDVPATIAYMQELGAEIVVNSTIDLKLLHQGEEGLLRYCDMLEQLRAALAPAGIALAHHNHHYEFLRAGGGNVLAFLAAHSQVDFALDTYWCQKGGGNVLTLLEDLRGRVPVMHLRDFTITKRGLVTGGTDSEIGRGNIPFHAILKAAQAAGVRYGMIEQKTKTPMESIGISWNALGAISY